MAELMRLYQQNPMVVQIAAIGFLASLLLFNWQRFRPARGPLQVRAQDAAHAIEQLIALIDDPNEKNLLSAKTKDALAAVRLHGHLLNRWITERT